MRTAALLGVVLLSGGALSFAEPSVPNDPSAQLKAAVLEFQPKLGALEEWQKKIFNEEAVPQYSRFIRDYKAATGKTGALNIVIDEAMLHNFLAFYAPKALKQEAPKILVALRIENACEKCKVAAVGLKNSLKNRLTLRGFNVVWVAAQKSDEGLLDGKMSADPLFSDAESKRAAAFLLVRAHFMHPEENDTAHADEVRFAMDVALSVPSLGAAGMKREGSLEVLENDSLLAAMDRLLTESLVELGVKAKQVQALGVSVGGKPTLIEVKGITDFAQYSRFKNSLQQQLGTDVWVEERKISRGNALLSVSMGKSTEIVKLLKSLPADAGQIIVLAEPSEAPVPGVEGMDRIQVELK
ncbi:hypothetical protein WDW86_14400 [Bdellovibrionota bacterium FG-2]